MISPTTLASSPTETPTGTTVTVSLLTLTILFQKLNWITLLLGVERDMFGSMTQLTLSLPRPVLPTRMFLTP
jgi:hypothetical protein